MEDDEYKKLPLDERCVHKLWKARVNGYEEVAKLFRQIDDEKSPEFAKYLGLVKKFVTDSNAMGQEKGLEATLAFAENYAHAGKTVGEVMSGIVHKCIAAPKTKTRELALQLTLTYIEIEKQDAVVDELLKGLDLKNPKIVAACVTAITIAVREFGSKVIQLKPIVKKIPILFADRDKNVRDESRLLVIEMYRWVGTALKSQLSTLQPVQVTELEAEFAKIDGHKAVPLRYLRSQQEKQAKLAVAATDGVDEEVDDDEVVDEPVNLDPYELAEPIDILSKLPKDFYDKAEAKKWQERKEALETLEKLLKSPKLENGDYGDLVRTLKKMVQKDSNVVVVALAAKCLHAIASGLKKRFQPYASSCIPTMLEKFKEKKQNVVLALRDAVDSIYLATTMENVLDDAMEALASKNPSVKTETASFLARAFTRTSPAAMNKKLLKALTGALIKLTNEPDPAVRDASAEAIGTLMKLVGEKALAPFLIELEKDANKMGKIRESFEKTVIVVKAAGGKKEKAKFAKPADVKPAARVSNASGAKRKTEIVSGSATIVKSKGKTSKALPKIVEREMSEVDASEIAGECLPVEVIAGLVDANWKNRLAAVEQFLSVIQALDVTTMPVQAFVKCVCKKPGLKDTNFQVLKGRMDIVKFLASSGKFSTTTANICINDIAEKLGDAKNGPTAGDTLTAMAQATSLNHVATAVFEFALMQKSPKVLQESLGWIGTAIKEFGFNNLNTKFLLDSTKKALASNNSAVRTAAISLYGVFYLYMGASIHVHIENEKASVRELINSEFDKYENEKPPAPIRGVLKSESCDSVSGRGGDECESGDAISPIHVEDVTPRTDISGQITEGLLTELADKNWKVRNEALTKVSNIITEAKFLKPNIGDLPQALSLRLVDSNSKIAQTTFNICENIATAMGAPCKQYVRTLFPGFLQGLADSKAWIRSASLNCMNAFGDQGGYKEFFEGEMIHDALKSGSPILRCELWVWLAEKLPKIPVKQIPKEELVVCIPYLYANMEDRSVDVRKNAHEAILGVMIHVGFEGMVKQLEKLKPGSKSIVLAQLEKVRPNLPAKPAPVKKQTSEEKTIRGGGGGAAGSSRPASSSKANAKRKSNAIPASRKKEEDVDTSPLFTINSLKHQRAIDEAKLKVLRWNFTAPRQEFFDQLKDQMMNANFNKTLVSNMFHVEFKFHIRALDALSEDLQEHGEAMISNLDLLLKWLTLRFFDTNPSVLLKGLEYLSSVFNSLIQQQYHLLESEAHCFIPYLITKIGDPKDAVRNGVKTLIRQLWAVYSVNRLFSTYLLDGLKSKNARQRAECLEAMGLTIAHFGMNVCSPSPQACMREVAKQVSDRDNAVRNAALNCAVQAYYIVGEKIFKMVGHISDKDMSLLEERIKRASKKPPPPVMTQMNTTKVNKIDLTQNMNLAAQVSPVKEQCDDDEDEYDDHDEVADGDNLPEVVLPSQVAEKVSPEQSNEVNIYALDAKLIGEWDAMSQPLPVAVLEVFDLEFLNDDYKTFDVRAIPVSPPKPIVGADVQRHSVKTAEMLQLEQTLLALAGSNATKAMEAISALEAIVRSNKSGLVKEYEDKMLHSIYEQLVHLKQFDPSTNTTYLRLYRNLLTVFDVISAQPDFGKTITVITLRGLISEMLKLIVEDQLNNVPSKDSYVRVLNMHCVKLIERADHTVCICALVQNLHECLRYQGSTTLTELVMKCLWRVIKKMPSWEDDIDCTRVLCDVHKFFKDYPSLWWRNKSSDTPLRTIKTLVHSLGKVIGTRITEHLANVPNLNDSELEGYVHKMLRTIKVDEVKQVPLKTESRRVLPRASQTQLTEIFKKIGSKVETKEGLNLLYDFMQQNPESDVEPFLQRSSNFFQEYVRDNMKEIENQRKKNGAAPEANGNCAAASNCNEEKSLKFYQERLDTFEEQWDRKNANN